MGNRQAAFGFAIALILSGVPDARSTAWGATPGLQPSPATGLRTDRLSARQRRRWRAIVDIVRAEDRQHRPLHPTLLALFDAVDAGPHTVFIEMVDAKSYVAGRFRVTSVDVEGRAHQAVLILNLRAIDKASTDRVAARADGFIPFKGLTRYERYAEVLGHELAHAAWHLASTERATLAYWLGSLEEWRRMPLKERRAGRRRDPRPRNTELVSVGWELERQAETAERAIWEELQAAKREPHSARAREESRSRATGPRVGGLGGVHRRLQTDLGRDRQRCGCCGRPDLSCSSSAITSRVPVQARPRGGVRGHGKRWYTSGRKGSPRRRR